VSVMNHASIMTVFETGRMDLMVRSNFLSVATKHKWFVPLQAVSVQYYRPLKAFQKAKIHTRISYVDDKWIYIEQKIERNGKVVAVCICKSTIKDGRETVSPFKIMDELKLDQVPTAKYDLIETYETESAQLTANLADNWGE
jgi:acyl-CoA thioesterase FadM